MNLKKVATSTITAGLVGAAALGLGAGVASAAPQAPNHQQGQQFTQHGPQIQRQTTVRRPNYGPFVYRGVRVFPRYDVRRHAWGFTFQRDFVHVVTGR